MCKLLWLTLSLGLGLALSAHRAVAGSDDAKDWPQWRGPTAMRVSTEKNLLKEWPEKGPPLVWNSARSTTARRQPRHDLVQRCHRRRQALHHGLQGPHLLRLLSRRGNRQTALGNAH